MKIEAPSDRELAQLKFDLDRSEREARRQAQREHGVRWHDWDESTRDLAARCAFCGMSAATYYNAVRLVAQDWAGTGASGHLSLGFCAFCGKLYRFTGTEAAAVALSGSLERADMAGYYPSPARDEAASIRANNRRARAGLSWAGWAFRARVAGAEDPGDVKIPYSHLEGLKPSVIDFAPQMPEPELPRRLPVS